MQKIKVVQIGIGHDHGLLVFKSIMKQTDIFEVVGFAVPPVEEVPFADKIEEIKNNYNVPYMSVEEALNVPGIVGAVIETEEVNLTKYAQMAADRGLHIHMDKPGGLDLAAYENLIQTVKDKNLAFSVGYMYRFNPKIKDAIAKVRRGELGEIYCVEAQMDCLHKPEKRQWLSTFPGGMMFFLGCHLVDLIYRIQGEPEEVIPYNMPTNCDDVTAKDFGMALFKYPNGISFAKSCANEFGGFMRRQLVICGSKGTIEIKPIEVVCGDEGQYTSYCEVYEDKLWDKGNSYEKTELFDRYDDMMKNYAQMANGEKENEYTYDYELNLYKLVLKACGEKV